MLHPVGRRMSRSWCSARHPAWTLAFLVVFTLRTATSCTVMNNGTVITGLKIYANDTSPEGTAVATFQTTDVSSVTADNAYFEVTFDSTTGEIQLLTTKAFESYEKNNNLSTITVLNTVKCADNTEQKLQVNIVLNLSNKYAPAFIAKGQADATAVALDVAMPLHKGYAVLGGCAYALQAIDYGLDSSVITFSVDQASFSVSSTETFIGGKPGYEVALTTAALVDSDVPLVVTITAKDGGSPVRSTELMVTLTPNAADSTPQDPWFTKAVYSAEITETMSAGDTLTFDTDIIVSEGYDSFTKLSLESTDGSDSMFSASANSNAVRIVLNSTPTEEFLKKPFAAIVLKAKRDKALKEGRTVILLTLPGSKPVTTTTSTTIATTACPTTVTETTTHFDCSMCPTSTSTSQSTTPCFTDCSQCTTFSTMRTTAVTSPTTSSTEAPATTPLTCPPCPAATTECPATSSITPAACPMNCSQCPASECLTTASTATTPAADCSHCPATQCPVTTQCPPTVSGTDTCPPCPTQECPVTTQCPSTVSGTATCPPCPTTECPATVNGTSTCPPCPVTTQCPQTVSGTATCPACPTCPTTECPVTTQCPPTVSGTATCPACPTCTTTECPATTQCPPTVSGTATCPACPTCATIECPVTTQCPPTVSGTATCPACPTCPTTESSVTTQCPPTVNGTSTCPPCPVTTQCPPTVSGTSTCPPCPVTTQCPPTVSGTTTCPACPTCPTTESSVTTQCPPTVNGTSSCPACVTDCPKCTTPVSKATTVITIPSQPSRTTKSTTGFPAATTTAAATPQLVKFNELVYLFSGQWPCSGDSVTLGVVTATVDGGEGSPTYSLEDAPASVVVNGTTGYLTLLRPLVPKNYKFKVAAKWKDSKDTATVVVTVPNLESCGSNTTKLRYVFVITDFDEEHAYNVSSEQPVDGGNCTWTKVSEEPPNMNFFQVSADGAISTEGIDREDGVFSKMSLAEVLLQVNVTCADDQQDDGDLVPEDTPDSSKPWYPLKSLRTSTKEVTYLAVVDDINDNKPQFVEGSPLVVGYPDKQLAKQLVPQSLVTVHATDKDVGLNAYVRYEIVNDDGAAQVVVHPHTGTVYPSESSFSFEDTAFRVVAKDQDGAPGCLQSDYLTVQVRILGSQHVSVLTVEGRLVEDTDSLMQQIQASSGVHVKVLSSAVVPSSAVSTKSWLSRHLLADTSPNSLLRLVVYALDASNKPVNFSDVKQKLDNSKLGFKFEILQLPEAGSSTTYVTGSSNNSGLVAAVATLGVLLGLTLLAVAGVFYYFFRRRRSSSESSYDDIIRADSSDSPSFLEPPMSPYDANIMMAYNDQLNKYDEQSRSAHEALDENSDEEDVPPRKSVAFNPDVDLISEASGVGVIRL